MMWVKAVVSGSRVRLRGHGCVGSEPAEADENNLLINTEGERSLPLDVFHLHFSLR